MHPADVGGSETMVDRRIVIPAELRQSLTSSDNKLVVTIDRNGCHLGYPLRDWEEVEQKLLALPSTDQKRATTPAVGGWICAGPQGGLPRRYYSACRIG